MRGHTSHQHLPEVSLLPQITRALDKSPDLVQRILLQILAGELIIQGDRLICKSPLVHLPSSTSKQQFGEKRKTQ